MTENPIAARLQALLVAKGLTLADVARDTQVSYHTVNNLWRRPAAKLSAENAEKLAAALGTTSRYILFGEVPPTEDRRAMILDLYDSSPASDRQELEDFALFLAARRAKTAR